MKLIFSLTVHFNRVIFQKINLFTYNYSVKRNDAWTIDARSLSIIPVENYEFAQREISISS